MEEVFFIARRAFNSLFSCEVFLFTTYLCFLCLHLIVARAKLERMMCSFFWGGNKGSKINHLVRWSLDSKAQVDGASDWEH